MNEEGPALGKAGGRYQENLVMPMLRISIRNLELGNCEFLKRLNSHKENLHYY